MWPELLQLRQITRAMQSGRQARAETEAEPQAEAGTGPVSSSDCAALSLSPPLPFSMCLSFSM